MARSGELESQISEQLSLRDQEAALKLIQQFATERNDPFTTYYYMLEAHLLLSAEGKVDYDSALHYCNLMVESSEATSKINFEARIRRARVYRSMGDYLHCMEEIQELLADPSVETSVRRSFLVDVELFRLYVQIGDLENAKTLITNLKRHDETITIRERYESAMALGTFYLECDSLVESRMNFAEAFEASFPNSARDKVDAWHMLAEVDKSAGDFDGALKKYESILHFEDSVGYRHGFIHTLLIATETALMAEKDPREISAYANQAYAYALKLNNKLRLVQAMTAKGYFFKVIDQPDSAITYLDKARLLASEIEAHYWERSSSRMLVEIYKTGGDFESAMKYQQLVNAADSKLRKKNQTEIAEMVKNVHLVYKYRHDKEVSELELERQEVYLVVWISVSVSAIAIALLLLLMYQKQRKQNRFLTQKALQEAKRKKVQATRSEKDESQKTTLDDSVYSELRQHLEHFVEQNGYRDPECSLSSLAKAINTNTSYLSKYLNEEEQISFNQWLNSLRVVDFIERIKNNPEITETYTLEYIAGESGFKSKSTFIRAFKKHTGITPSVFLKNM